jgi:transcription elongation factor GreB
MSRAFVKEMEEMEQPLEPPELPPSTEPNYITPAGLAELRGRLAKAREDNNERDMRRLQGRISVAIPVSSETRPRDRVEFGAHVELLDEDGREHRYQIVGEDEVDPENGRVSWRSPLAKALKRAKVGDSVIWERPAGDLELEVVSIRYDN